MLAIKIFSERKKLFRERKKCEKIHAKREETIVGEDSIRGIVNSFCKVIDEMNKSTNNHAVDPVVGIAVPSTNDSDNNFIPNSLHSVTGSKMQTHNINDVAELFGVPLNSLKDIDDFVQDPQYVVLSESTCKPKGAPIIVDNPSVKVLPKDPKVDDKLFDMVSPSDLIVQSVDINTKSTSYDGVASASTKDQPKVNSNFRPLVADLFFDGVNISISRKVVKRVMSPPNVSTSNVVTPTVEKTIDGFQIVGKKKMRKGKSKSINGGQFARHSVKQNVRYEPKAATSVSKGATNVGNASNLSSKLRNIGTSFNEDNITFSNSFSSLNVEEGEEEEKEEEAVENMYDETANLFTKSDGSSFFTVAVG
nr:zinc knuckle CX2CX4HX4C [Tanacetum cinerariifolium]